MCGDMGASGVKRIQLYPKNVVEFYKCTSFLVVTATSFWWTKMKRYMAEEKEVAEWRDAFESGNFPLYLSDFLFHKDGAQEREKSFKFDGELVCNEPAPPIKVRN